MIVLAPDGRSVDFDDILDMLVLVAALVMLRTWTSYICAIWTLK